MGGTPKHYKLSFKGCWVNKVNDYPSDFEDYSILNISDCHLLTVDSGSGGSFDIGTLTHPVKITIEDSYLEDINLVQTNIDEFAMLTRCRFRTVLLGKSIVISSEEVAKSSYLGVYDTCTFYGVTANSVEIATNVALTAIDSSFATVTLDTKSEFTLDGGMLSVILVADTSSAKLSNATVDTNLDLTGVVGASVKLYNTIVKGRLLLDEHTNNDILLYNSSLIGAMYGTGNIEVNVVAGTGDGSTITLNNSVVDEIVVTDGTVLTMNNSRCTNLTASDTVILTMNASKASGVTTIAPTVVLTSTGEYVEYDTTVYTPYTSKDTHGLLLEIMANDPLHLIGEREIYVIPTSVGNPVAEVAGKIYNTVEDAITYLNTLVVPISHPDGLTLNGTVGSMVYDSIRKVHVLLGGLHRETMQYKTDTWEYDGTNWALISTATNPNVDSSGCLMVFDSDRGVVVMVKGGSPCTTWEYNGTNWSDVSNPSSPLPAGTIGGVMCYDSARHLIVLYNGDWFAGGSSFTWEYDGTALTWTSHNYTPPDTATNGGFMVFDSSRNVSVYVSFYKGLWEYNGTTWTNKIGGYANQNLYGYGAYDSTRNVTTWYGTNTFDSICEWNGSSVSTRTPGATRPTFSAGPFFSYDIDRQKCVMFGGLNASYTTTKNDTWEWDGAAALWHEITGVSTLTKDTAWNIKVFGTNTEGILISIPDWVTIVGDGNTLLDGQMTTYVTNHMVPFYNVIGCRISDLVLNGGGYYLALKDCIIEASHLASGVAGLTFDNCTLDGTGVVNLDLSTATSVTLSGCKLGNMTLGTSSINNCETISGKSLALEGSPYFSNCKITTIDTIAANSRVSFADCNVNCNIDLTAVDNVGLTLDSTRFSGSLDLNSEDGHGVYLSNVPMLGNITINNSGSGASSVIEIKNSSLGNIVVGGAATVDLDNSTCSDLTMADTSTVTLNNSSCVDTEIEIDSTLDIRNSVVNGYLFAATGSTLKKYNTQVIGDETIEDGVDEEDGDAETALTMAMITLTGN